MFEASLNDGIVINLGKTVSEPVDPTKKDMLFLSGTLIV